MYNFSFGSGYCLTHLDRKSDLQPVGVPPPPRRPQASPTKTLLASKFEDYNDSGYDGSPLSPGK